MGSEPTSFPVRDVDPKRILVARERGIYILGDADAEMAERAVFRASALLPITIKSRKDNIERALRSDCGERRASNRAYLDRNRTFDQLVMMELLDAEKMQEKNGYQLDEKEFIKRFVKHLVLLSLARNSFWAVIANCSILCNYKAKELGLLYSFVAPNRAEPKGEPECSRVRSNLLKFMAERFGVRFQELLSENDSELYSPSDWQVGVVTECLGHFRPPTTVTVPEGFRWDRLFAYDENDPRGDERIEVDRMGVLFSPTDFNRIATCLGIRPFEESIRRMNFRCVRTASDGEDDAK